MQFWSACGVVLILGVARASVPYATMETLAGWSDDGERFAVVVSRQGQETSLTVRERAPAGMKTIATFEGPPPDDGGFGNQPPPKNPNPEPSKIDVEKWAPIKKHGLKKIDAASRKRFDTELELKTAGMRSDPYSCKNASWTLRRKGTTKVIHEVKAKGGSCFTVRGGYLHANGKRALVKITEASYSNPGDGGDTNEDTSFVLVDVPPK